MADNTVVFPASPAQDMSFGSAPVSGAPEVWHPLLSFQGKGSELFWVYVRNFLFTLLTLGIYSFWAKVRVREYLWSRTRLWGEPFEYTGTGKELFISFLIVMPVFMLFAFLYHQIAEINPVLALAISIPLFTFIINFAIYRTLRYRLTRTKWRGIRGNLAGSAVTFAGMATLYMLLGLVTLGLLMPWAITRTTSYHMNNTYFGDQRIRFTGKARGLYRHYFLLLLGIAAMGAAIAGLVYLSLDFEAMDHAVDRYGLSDHAPFMPFVWGYLAFIIGAFIIQSFFEAALARWFFGNMAFRAMRLRSTLQGMQLLSVRVTNLLLVLFTLGIGYAWARVRNLRLTINAVEYSGEPDVENMLQDTMPAPKRGEGLLEALDVDVSI